ncbi:response regulator transcription factor [Sphingobacteriaceae bacterium WQ 2009]|uniref:Response regulator transcription factor n=1 Tax=Rhinopithecimicrobium faecis TaxID=2820698 RepID=A0A8T4H957_9SPHI|nr:response regulator transcription factor [Sphingobacteriaceae bacterium WQ 2009]
MDYCKRIKQKFPKIIILGINNQAERCIIFQFLENSGAGYILENANAKEVLQCIDTAIADNITLSKEVQEIMQHPSPSNFELPRLTKREQKILLAISNGATSAEIAEKLFISATTVEMPRRNPLQKFRAKK